MEAPTVVVTEPTTRGGALSGLATAGRAYTLDGTHSAQESASATATARTAHVALRLWGNGNFLT
jgi:CHASE1-domain containing sensor protein